MNRTVAVIPHTPRSRWYVFSTPHLRDLAIRHRLRLVPGCNYVLKWHDVNGFGLHLTVSQNNQPS